MSNLVCEGFSSCSTEIWLWKCWVKCKKKKKIDDVTFQYSIHRSVQYGTTVDRPAAIGYKRSTFCNNFFSFRIFFQILPSIGLFIYLFIFSLFVCLFFFLGLLHPFQKILAIGLTVKFRQNKAPLHHFGCKFSKLPVHDMYPREGNNQVCSVYTYMWDHRNEKKMVVFREWMQFVNRFKKNYNFSLLHFKFNPTLRVTFGQNSM